MPEIRTPTPPKRRVLVADDNEDALAMLALLLESEGHEVCTASNGPQALEFAETFRPDIAFLDIGMPKMSGYELASRIRIRPWGQQISLVALSGWRILRETTLVLLESAPAELDTTALATTIRETEGVASFHDLHAWRISDGFDAVTVHVVLAPRCHGVEVSQRVCQRVEALHGIRHVTVQAEAPPPAQLVQLGRQRSS